MAGKRHPGDLYFAGLLLLVATLTVLAVTILPHQAPVTTAPLGIVTSSTAMSGD